MRTFVIAEAGANHNREWDLAKLLVKAAVNAKSDAVKFQTYKSSELYSTNTPDFAGYQDIPDLIRSLEIPREWHRDLKMLCDDVGIEFMSTPFDAQTKLPIIFSAGVGTSLQDVVSIIDYLTSEGSSDDITVLHCNSAYPTPIEDACLGQIPVLIKEVGQRARVGFSDHTLGIFAPPIAVALGAEVVEKHFTLDRTMKGPDHPFAIEPSELIEMVSRIRDAEIMLRQKTGMTDSESSRRMWQALRSVVIARPVHAGSKITQEDLTTKRPFNEGAIPADRFFEIGEGSFTARSDLAADHILLWSDLVEMSNRVS